MKLKLEQLANQLQHQIAPLYLISGDEVVLKQQACLRIRKHLNQAHELDFRRITLASANDNWDIITQTLQSGDLFASKQLIHLDLPTGKPGRTGSQVLVDSLSQLSADQILLITTPKLDSAQQRSKWLTAIEKAGIFIQIWPVGREEMPRWLTQCAKEFHLNIEPAALNLLADYSEGNLLAGQQEIEKLQLRYGKGAINAEQLRSSISQHHQYDPYTLLESALAGQTPRTLKILQTLQSAGVDAGQLLWILVRELRLLITLHCQSAAGEPLSTLWKKHRVWQNRQPGLQRALKAMSLKQLQQLLLHTQHCDRMLKGRSPGNLWHKLFQLYLRISK